MNETQILLTLLCLSPFVSFALCAFWRVLELNARENDTRRFPRPGTHPERPDGFKPFRKHPDMLTKVDDE